VAGLIIDDRLTTMTPDTVPPITTGGSVTINSYNTTLKSGSSIDVSGGVEVTASAKANFGAGGKIVITAGQDPNVPSIIGGHLLLGATLRGYAGSQQGGSLSILAPLAADSWEWTLARAFALSCESRGRITLVGIDESSEAEAARLEARFNDEDLERLIRAKGVDANRGASDPGAAPAPESA
jgi:hypothetical protein